MKNWDNYNKKDKMNKYFFNNWGYQPSEGWESRNQQLKEAGFDNSKVYDVFGNGYENNGEFAEYDDKEGGFMSRSEQLEKLGINESDYGLVYGVGYTKTGAKSPEILTLKCVSIYEPNGYATVDIFAYSGQGAVITEDDIDLWYSLNGGEWQKSQFLEQTSGLFVESGVTGIHFQIGDTIKLRGENVLGYNSFRFNIQVSGNFEAHGDVTSLINNVGGDVSLKDMPGCFSDFSIGSEWGELVTPPNLPSTELSEECYSYMFTFQGFTEAPELPANTLEPSCYLGMFQNCASLTKVVLPATTLVEVCYENMFLGCSNLNYVKVGFTEFLYDENDETFEYCNGNKATCSWLSDVSQTGTFVWNGDATNLERSPDTIPSGWAV